MDVGSTTGGCGALDDNDGVLDERRAADATWSGDTFGGGAPLTMRSNCDVAIVNGCEGLLLGLAKWAQHGYRLTLDMV